MPADRGTLAVSVIVPARDEAALLPGCLVSLADLEPFGGGLEVIVADNDSSDRTPEIARGMGATVVRTRARTIAAVRNEGARAARGRVLAFVDADCAVDPAWLKHALPHFDSPRVAAVGSYPLAPSSGASWLQETWSFLARRPSALPGEVAWLSANNLLVRASAFRAVGGFDQAFETCEDVDLCYRLRDIGAIVYDDSVRVLHRRLPRTLPELFRTEVWHGKHSYDGIGRGRLVPEELPSLLAPPVTLLGALGLHVGGALALAGQTRRCFWTGAAGLLAAPLLYAARAALSKGRPLHTPTYVLVYLTYFLARAAALLLWTCRRARHARRRQAKR